MICRCGCGTALTGKQTKWASHNCQHRAMWQERKESQAIQRRERRRLLRAAEVIATTPDLRKHLDCEHRHGRGKCWKHAAGCQTARASGLCSIRETPPVSALLAPAPGRKRSAPMLRPAKCERCGVEFLARRNGARLFCTPACRQADAYEHKGRRGHAKMEVHLPADRISDGKRRCRWCQEEFEHKDWRVKDCCRLHRDRSNQHNLGRSHSASVISWRV